MRESLRLVVSLLVMELCSVCSALRRWENEEYFVLRDDVEVELVFVFDAFLEDLDVALLFHERFCVALDLELEVPDGVFDVFFGPASAVVAEVHELAA